MLVTQPKIHGSVSGRYMSVTGRSQHPDTGPLGRHDPMAEPQFIWGEIDQLNKAYSEVVHWKRNIFSVPSGKAGKSELSRLSGAMQRAQHWNRLHPESSYHDEHPALTETKSLLRSHYLPRETPKNMEGRGLRQPLARRQDHSAAVRIKEETPRRTRPARSCFLKLNVEREHKGGPETHLEGYVSFT